MRPSASLSRTGTSSQSTLGWAAFAPCGLVELHQLRNAAFIFQFLLHRLWMDIFKIYLLWVDAFKKLGWGAFLLRRNQKESKKILSFASTWKHVFNKVKGRLIKTLLGVDQNISFFQHLILVIFTMNTFKKEKIQRVSLKRNWMIGKQN